ncbi:uncharacterized protein LOC143691935 [Agelaius phoeniceus]|uniref:uncharacterized protein LOC143691935 n=1 Tax=Agelaius phoeniceus TaxID=39638 RepID=UPI004054E0F7
MQKDKIQGRAPIPGAGIPPSRRSRPRAAVKAEWARWSTCHLSWPSTPMSGAVAALGTPRNGGGQVSSGQPPEPNQDLRYPEEAVAQAWKRQHRSTHGEHLHVHVRPRMDFARSSSKS